MGNTLCIIVGIVYAAVIVFGYLKRQKVKKVSEINVSSGITTSEAASKILLSSSLYSEEELLEQEQLQEEEDEEEDEEPNRRRFNFAGSQKEEVVKKETIEVQLGTELVTDESDYISINYGEKKISISQDIYNSTSMTDIGTSAYYASKLIAEYKKPFKYSFISFITLLPRLVIQISWLICAAYIVGAMPLTENVMAYISIATLISFAINLLNIFYPKYIATKALSRMIKNEIITENELVNANIVVSSLAESEITDCFGFLKFFLRKIMGYDI